MPELSAEQREHAIGAMREYLQATAADGRSLVEAQAERDCERARVIDTELAPLLRGYLEGSILLSEFKSQIDSINKRNTHWGFKGIKGQMFFNISANVAGDLAELDAELRAVLVDPVTEETAKSRMRTFERYVRRIGEEHVEAGGRKQGRPNPGSIPFFVSYFWQIQNRDLWPVHYTNSVNAMADLNLWDPPSDLAESYVRFKHIHEELAEAFAEASGRTFTLYDVEHVFWYQGGNPYTSTKEGRKRDAGVKDPGNGDGSGDRPRLPDSYVPPIVAVLPGMAANEAAMVEAAAGSGTSLERAFEKSLNAAFIILGFDTVLMGQGQGRVPDGLAVDADNSYALIWDAKVRTNGYSMGTDDRTIREYISTQSRDLKRRRSLRNIYYVVISSGFKDDYDDAIRSIKMETDVGEVCLVEAEAIVAMVDAKLRDPLQLGLGPDGLQRLFSDSGVISVETVTQTLG